MRVLSAFCHCRRVEVLLSTARDPLPVRRCSCSHCAPQHFRYTADPSGSARIKGPTRAYRFGTETADFVRCDNCGFFIGAACEADGRKAVLNADLFEPLRDREGTTADFDNESADERLERRSKTWTPVADS